MKILKLSALTAVVLALALASASSSAVESQTIQEAPTTDLNVLTDDLFNGLGARGTPIDECVGGPPVPNRSFEDNKFIFEERETVDDGLGPTYNDVGCVSCHQSPETGGISQTNELRAGHLNSAGTFVNPPGGSSLIQLRAIAAPIQERLDNAPLENIRTFRTSLNIIGDGFVEAIANDTLTALRDSQPAEFRGTIINVPVVEADGALRIGRFGWKNQHASLQSFSGDAYLNEMGITNPFDGNGGTVENNSLGASVAAFDTVADPEDDGADVEAFANFMRATRAPGRGTITAAAQPRSELVHADQLLGLPHALDSHRARGHAHQRRGVHRPAGLRRRAHTPVQRLPSAQRRHRRRHRPERRGRVAQQGADAAALGRAHAPAADARRAVVHLQRGDSAPRGAGHFFAQRLQRADRRPEGRMS